MLSENWLPTVRQAIRDFIVIPDAEPVDTVMLATFLVNHVPNRPVNVWMVIVAPQGEAKTELLNLVCDHPSVWQLPDRLSPAYFLSSKTLRRSSLFRMDEAGSKLFLMSDMSSLTDGVDPKSVGDIDTQLKNIHDGKLAHETGLNSQRLVWTAREPIGWLGAGTEHFYRWAERSHVTGSRFMVYYYDPSRYRHWTDTADLEEIQARQSTKAHTRTEAKLQVQKFLEQAISELGSFDRVQMSKEADGRIAAAARFTARVLGGGALQDSGTRRSVRVRELVRMFAFMHGRDYITDADVNLGIRIVLSQLPPDTRRTVEYALKPERRLERWKGSDYHRHISIPRKSAEAELDRLVDAEILDRSKKRGVEGYGYLVTEPALKIVERFDAKARMFE